METPIIRVKDVHKSYGRGPNRFDALKGVSFDIHEGESIAIIGKSGSGKSTLMHVLALLDAPTSGSIELEGVDTRTLKGKSLNRARNKTFGFVFQQFFLTANASVLENVMLPMKRRVRHSTCLVVGQTVQLAAGAAPATGSDALELNLPVSYLESLGFANADAAVGETLTIAITDAERTQHLVDATIVGVAEESLAAPGAGRLVVNSALTDELYETQNIGIPTDQQERYAQASIRFDPISVAVIILVVMAIAFLAGTIPAARAARADPVESLRYE